MNHAYDFNALFDAFLLGTIVGGLLVMALIVAVEKRQGGAR